jgi:hypothetical protein
MNTEKELLVYIATLSVEILVPKKRGQGFLKMPLGHYACPLSELSHKIGYDLTGLDGSLDVEARYVGISIDTETFIAQAIVPISEFYQMPFRIVGAKEFWDKHPLR